MGELEFGEPCQLSEDDDISGFSCGIGLVDGWLANRARKAKRNGTAVVYASWTPDDVLAGFYSLTVSSVERASAPGWLARNTPEQIPVLLLGMLGVDSRFQGEGLGGQLLLDAVHRSQLVADIAGAKALVVDPMDEASSAFYAHHGFRKIGGSGRMAAKLTGSR